jgi:hypothetical protein
VSGTFYSLVVAGVTAFFAVFTELGIDLGLDTAGRKIGV